MTAKKFTRGFFYVLIAALVVVFVTWIVGLIIQNWIYVWRPILGLGCLLGALAIALLAKWAFLDENEEFYTKDKLSGIDKLFAYERNRTLGYEHIETIKYHFPTEESAGNGIQGMCFCGEPIDDYIGHVLEIYEETK